MGGTFTRCVLQLRALVRTKALAKRWIRTKRRKSWTPSRTSNRGWTQIRRLILRRSRRSIRRWRAFARQLYLSTTVLVVAVEAKAVAMKMRRRPTMSCRANCECISTFVWPTHLNACTVVSPACAFKFEHGLSACALIGTNQGDFSKDLVQGSINHKK